MMNNNFIDMFNQFQQFRSNYRGDPKQEVMRLIQSGKMNQSQLNQLQQMANQFQAFMRNMK